MHYNYNQCTVGSLRLVLDQVTPNISAAPSTVLAWWTRAWCSVCVSEAWWAGQIRPPTGHWTGLVTRRISQWRVSEMDHLTTHWRQSKTSYCRPSSPHIARRQLAAEPTRAFTPTQHIRT